MAPIVTPQSSMAPAPLTAAGQGVQLGMPPPQGAGSISLSLLLDFLIQKTYHELTVLAELLPRKMDMERKEEIVKFAHSTRQSFIRFLALVKWAGSAAKVDKCADISAFLDHQCHLFVDTADMLSRMSRENLVNARLPNFCLPHAVDVLTLGQYKRLPTCIKEKIIPPDPITPQEKASVLGRLDQIIQHRLVTSQLPSQLSNLSIKEGRVKFHIPQEFEATLTLMEDNPAIPWRLLNVKILVQDPDTGEGKSLVHPMQVTYIHQLVQSRLFGDDKPLWDMYTCLHTFCQSLQLEVLHSQAQRLVRERWGEHVMVEKYIPGQSLTLAYWRAQNLNSTKKQEHYKVVVCIDNNDAAKPLQIVHNPTLDVENAGRICSSSIKCERLSIERLLVETILVRSRTKLGSLKQKLEKININTTVGGTPPLLHIPLTDATDNAEDDIRVSVDLQTGMLEPSVAHCDDAMIDDIDISLTSDLSKLPNLLTKIRLSHCVEKCKISIQTMPVSCSDSIPLIPLQPEHPLSKLSPTRLYIYLKKHSSYYVVVEFSPPKSEDSITVTVRYHLLGVRPAHGFEISSLPQPAEGVPPNYQYQDTSRVFYTPLSLVQIDSFSAIYGPGTPTEEYMVESMRKRSCQEADYQQKRRKYPLDVRCEKDLAHIVALCDGRIPFIKLIDELRKKGIPHQGIQTDTNSTGLVLKLCRVPNSKSVGKDINDALAAALLSCSFRLIQRKTQGLWQVELIFCKCPVVSSVPKEQGPLQHIYLNYEMSPAVSVLNSFFQDWESIANLYELVLGLPCALPYLTLPPTSRSSWLQEHSMPYSIMVDIVSYNYQKITIAYNRDKTHVVTVKWDFKNKEFKLMFGVIGPKTATNCHSLLRHCMQEELNVHKALPVLLRILCYTQSPLQAICKLPIMSVVKSSTNGILSPSFSFVLLPQSSSHFRLMYGTAFCLEIHCKGKNAVTIKDGAFSHFNIRTSIDGYMPIPGLKAFLDLYVDDSTSSRRHAITEEDNPASPMPMDTHPPPPQTDPFMAGPPQQYTAAASPMYNQKIGTQGATGGFAHPSSNPATPSSPHTSVLSQAYSMSPGASAYPLASPPNIIPSPSGVMRGGVPSPAMATGSPHHVPSPSSFIHTPPPNIQLSSPGQFISPPNVGGDVASSTGSPYPGTVGYPVPSPGQRNWPASPSFQGPSPIQRLVQSPGSAGGITQPSPGAGSIPQNTGIPRHSRTFPFRSAAATLPTLLSHDALHKLCTPSMIQGLSTNMCSPMERFLGASLMKRQIQKQLQNHDGSANQLQVPPTVEMGSIQFSSESLHYKISPHPTTMQYLQLSVRPAEDKEQYWTQEELRILEKYFETKVACPPFKLNAMTSFLRLQTVSPTILKDFIKILHLELRPDQSLKWQLEWCLTIHPCYMTTPGTVAFIIKQKILFFIKLTCINPAPPPGQEPIFETVGIVYDKNTNATSAVNLVKPPPANFNTITSLLKTWNDYNINKPDCSLFPAIRSLMSSLQLQKC